MQRQIFNIDEYSGLIQGALDDVFDLEGAIEYDQEFMGDAEKPVAPLRKEIEAMLAEIKTGTYTFGGEDLGFMRFLCGEYQMSLLFAPLLRLINHTRRNGLAQV